MTDAIEAVTSTKTRAELVDTIRRLNELYLEALRRLNELYLEALQELDSITDDHVPFVCDRDYAQGETIVVRVPRRYRVK